jgi:hypothetical protein
MQQRGAEGRRAAEPRRRTDARLTNRHSASPPRVTMTFIFPVVFVSGVVLMSFIEWAIHRWFMHLKRLPGWAYRLLPILVRVQEDHAVLHHHKYFKVFNHEPDPVGKDYNLRLKYWVGILLGIPIWLPLGLFWTWEAAAAFLVVIVLHHAAWNLIHSEMHNPKPRRWLQARALYRYLARHHWMHHRYPGKCYNVVLPPLADLLMGTYLRPSANDRALMAEIGVT